MSLCTRLAFMWALRWENQRFQSEWKRERRQSGRALDCWLDLMRLMRTDGGHGFLWHEVSQPAAVGQVFVGRVSNCIHQINMTIKRIYLSFSYSLACMLLPYRVVYKRLFSCYKERARIIDWKDYLGYEIQMKPISLMWDIQNATNLRSFGFSSRPPFSGAHYYSLHFFQGKRNHRLPYQITIFIHEPAFMEGGRWQQGYFMKDLSADVACLLETNCYSEHLRVPHVKDTSAVFHKCPDTVRATRPLSGFGRQADWNQTPSDL